MLDSFSKGSLYFYVLKYKIVKGEKMRFPSEKRREVKKKSKRMKLKNPKKILLPFLK